MTPEQLAQLQRETRSSIELTRNAKGDYQWVVKAYYEEGESAEALATIHGIDALLRADYLPKPDEAGS